MKKIIQAGLLVSGLAGSLIAAENIVHDDVQVLRDGSMILKFSSNIVPPKIRITSSDYLKKDFAINLQNSQIGQYEITLKRSVRTLSCNDKNVSDESLTLSITSGQSSEELASEKIVYTPCYQDEEDNNSRPPTEDNNTEDNSTVITFDGLEYRPITSAVTGRTWLDRNMGATQACESTEDTACYGDYYQWGRGADGHQVYRRETRRTIYGLTPNELEHLKDISDTFVRANNDGGAYGYTVYDWLRGVDNGAGIRQVYWARTDGSYICPVGYRVPTAEEFRAETDYAFFNMAYAGWRSGEPNGNRIEYAGLDAHFWTNTPIETGVNENATTYYFYKSEGSSSRHSLNRGRTWGLSVRCIEDQ